MERVELKLKDCDLDAVDLDGGCWGFGSMYGNDWHIYHVDDHLNETSYAFPEWLNDLINAKYNQGSDDKVSEIRKALNL
jgi:hypothetical protein